MRRRSRWYTDELLRTSTAKLKVELGPKRWREARSVHLEADGYAVDVALMDAPSPTSLGKQTRRFLVCPSCGSDRRTTLALVPGRGWMCQGCCRWRGRARRPSEAFTP